MNLAAFDALQHSLLPSGMPPLAQADARTAPYGRLLTLPTVECCSTPNNLTALGTSPDPPVPTRRRRYLVSFRIHSTVFPRTSSRSPFTSSPSSQVWACLTNAGFASLAASIALTNVVT